MVDIQKSAFQNHILDWDSMIATVCINLQKAARELTISCLVRYDCVEYYDDFIEEWSEAFFEYWGAMVETLSASSVHQGLLESLLEILKRQLVCEYFVQPLNGWWHAGGNRHHDAIASFRFLVKCNFAERLNAIGVRKWRMDVIDSVGTISSVDDSMMRSLSELATYYETIHN